MLIQYYTSSFENLELLSLVISAVNEFFLSGLKEIFVKDSMRGSTEFVQHALQQNLFSTLFFSGFSYANV